MADWTWAEITAMWDHPDWTAKEVGELVGHSAGAVRQQRHRMGRYNASKAPLCCMCGTHHVWLESPKAKRYGLCRSCFLDEERMRLEDAGRAAAVRQMRRRKRGK